MGGARKIMSICLYGESEVIDLEMCRTIFVSDFFNFMSKYLSIESFVTNNTCGQENCLEIILIEVHECWVGDGNSMDV